MRFFVMGSKAIEIDNRKRRAPDIWRDQRRLIRGTELWKINSLPLFSSEADRYESVAVSSSETDSDR